MRRFGLSAWICMAAVLVWVPGAVSEEAQEVFSFPLANLIHKESDLGIANGRITAGVNYKTLADLTGLYAPPFVSSDFRVSCTVDGEPIAASTRGAWTPNGMQSEGATATCAVQCETLAPYGQRAVVIGLTLRAKGAPHDAVVAGRLSGTLDVNREWEFARPQSKAATSARLEDKFLVLEQGEFAIVAGGDAGVEWNPSDGTFKATAHVSENAPVSLKIAISIGPRAEALETCKAVLPEETHVANAAELTTRVSEYLFRLPRFSCDNPQLTRLYYRSLAHGFLNRWEVPEFKLNPYYSTGSINGGCLCNYLWNFGEVWEIMPLFDPEALKTHVKQFLSIDLTKHFAFLPVTGEGFGPWYMVNQEKIIGLAYYYVLVTGDTSLLKDEVNGRTVLEHIVEHATYGDDLTKPVALIDYGASNSHLELRKQYQYNHVMPDLNGRRYNNYVFAARLSEKVGRLRPDLLERAEALKKVLHAELWDPQAKWFAFRDDKGKKELRYTCQMFKLLNSNVLTDESLQGLLSHWNTNEFLGAFGLHSLAKGDPAYDENDVDNGGPGACTGFPPQIMERLYKSGHGAEANELLSRILWWGEKLPYWGDSLYADRADYRKDTPLQCTIDGVAVAQMMIFGLFGIEPRMDGSIKVSPQLPPKCTKMSLEGVRMRGHAFDVYVNSGKFSVVEVIESKESPLGSAVLLPAKAF